MSTKYQVIHFAMGKIWTILSKEHKYGEFSNKLIYLVVHVNSQQVLY